MDQSERIESARRNVLWVFGLASLMAIGLGALVMMQAGVPPGIWIRNPIAWAAAAGVGVLLARRGWLGSSLPLIAVVVLALSFLGPGQEGVHRWLDLGPIQLNAAALVLPAVIAAFSRTSSTLMLICFGLIAALLAWQPDISQLAGFSLAAIVLVSTLRHGRLMLAASAILGIAAIALCLSRPDPLAPVAHVEGIFALAWSQSPGLAIAMGVSLAAAALSPLVMRSAHPLGQIAPLALTAYLVTTAAAFLLGAYPVPLAGYGLSFIIGWWLGISALCVRRAS